MANKRISELPLAASIDGTEKVEIVQAGVSKRTTAQDIADLGGGGGGSGITVGSTTITSGINSRIPFNNSGVYGESSDLEWISGSFAIRVGSGSVNHNTLYGPYYMASTRTGSGNPIVTLISAANGIVGTPAGDSVWLLAGAGHATGNGTGGHVHINAGSGGGSGASGGVSITTGISTFNPTRLLEVAGSVAIKAGTSTGQLARVGGVISTDTTTTGNVGAGDDTLQSYSVPANTLATNKDTLVGTCSGSFAATINNKRLRVKFGSTTIFDSGALAITSATDWTLEFEIIRTGSATQKCNTRLNTSSATLSAYCDYSTAAETLSGAVTLLVTGEATADNDIVKETFKLRWEPSE